MHLLNFPGLMYAMEINMLSKKNIYIYITIYIWLVTDEVSM